MAADTAPPHAVLLRDFVNTVELEDGADELDSPAALTRWLTAQRLLAEGEPAGPADLERALALREGLREVMGAHHDGRDAPQPVLDRLAAELPLRLSFAAGRPRLVPVGTGAAAALAALLAAVNDAEADGSWERLKACTAQTCRWAFYDGSRNRSRTWCDMGVCGNRQKTRAYRARHRTGSPE